MWVCVRKILVTVHIIQWENFSKQWFEPLWWSDHEHDRIEEASVPRGWLPGRVDLYIGYCHKNVLLVKEVKINCSSRNRFRIIKKN